MTGQTCWTQAGFVHGAQDDGGCIVTNVARMLSSRGSSRVSIDRKLTANGSRLKVKSGCNGQQSQRKYRQARCDWTGIRLARRKSCGDTHHS